MKIYIGADHRGFQMKEILKAYLENKEIPVVDCSSEKYDEDDDYVDSALCVAEKIAQNPKENRGILVCRSGIGVCMAANKVKGIRAGLVFNIEQAFLARNDDDINILCLASEFTDEERMKEITDIFLRTQFSGEEKHRRRLSKINGI